jgi:hypothetical protein
MGNARITKVHSTHQKSGEEQSAKQNNKTYNACRLVIDVSHSCINRFRKLLVRFEKLKGLYRNFAFKTGILTVVKSSSKKAIAKHYNPNRSYYRTTFSQTSSPLPPIPVSSCMKNRFLIGLINS